MSTSDAAPLPGVEAPRRATAATGRPGCRVDRAGRAVSARLGVPVRIAAASVPLVPEWLTAAERARCASLPTDARRRDWLLGRAALKELLGPGADTAALPFPHPRLSLTHAGGTAYAVVAAGGGVAGTGIDFEPARAAVDPRTARFFLSPAERAAAGAGDDLLRLWTVKEALFKATPGNAGVVLADYRLGEPSARHGAAAGPGGEDLRYATLASARGVLTVAVCLHRRRRRAAV